jgi:hypothetical protein
VIKFNEITWYSKLAAIVLFIGILPSLCFYMGMRYGEFKSEMSVTSMVATNTSPSLLVSEDTEIEYFFDEFAPPDQTWVYRLITDSNLMTGQLRIDGFQTLVDISIFQKVNQDGSSDIYFSSYNNIHIPQTQAFEKGDLLFKLMPIDDNDMYPIQWRKLQPALEQNILNSAFKRVVD